MNQELYDLMISKNYPEAFAKIISFEMNTEYTGGRMLRYISRGENLSMEEIADEMLAILADREHFKDKHMSQHAQEKINIMYREGFEEEGDE